MIRPGDKVTKRCGRRLKPGVRIALLFWFLSLGIPCTGFAQSYRVTGVDFRVDDDLVVVSYDLESDKRRPKWFTIRLLFAPGEGLEMWEPRSLVGDVGRVRPGAGKSIRWLVLDEFPDGLDLERVRFTVEATPSRSYLGRLPRPVRLGAAAVIVGGLTVGAVLLARGSSYPEPPSRPTSY